MTDEIDAPTIIARALKSQGVEIVFGIVGVPVIEVADAIISEGIKFVGFRNEQSASYAAGCWGYITGRPGVCLCVSGPGVIHTLAGMSNAWANAWPMIVIGGSCDQDQEGMGAFQEFPQVESARLYCKLSARISSINRIPFYIEKAVKTSIFGRPGAVYLDIPADTLRSKTSEKDVTYYPCCPNPPKILADPNSVLDSIKLLRSAKSPLVIIGKGAAYSRAENEVLKFITQTNLPFLPTPMGKGVISDEHHQNVGAARSRALSGADVILLIGARLNWILHFGLPPRFHKNVKIIQIDICSEEIGTNIQASVALVGDIQSVMKQLNQGLSSNSFHFSSDSDWWKDLKNKVDQNQTVSNQLFKDSEIPMSYYRAFFEIKNLLPKDAIVVSEGSNTMDIGRTVIPNHFPRHKLDAGTFGTMGVGLGFAIAAAFHNPSKRVVCIEGDSAFGFSGMEVETSCRHRLGIIFIVINNNGIFRGVDDDYWKDIWTNDNKNNENLDKIRGTLPPTALLPNARYDKIAEAFGGVGFFCRTPEELRSALSQSLSHHYEKRTVLINVMVSPYGMRKAQEFSWLTRPEKDSKL